MPPPKQRWKNANVPKPVSLPKGTLIKINFGEHENEVKRIWAGKPPMQLVKKWQEQGIKNNAEKYYSPPSMQFRYNAIRQLVGNNNNKVGYCSKCRAINSYILKEKIKGCTVITRFCEQHKPDNYILKGGDKVI